eukprot:COSAG02_NODE_5370_length_4393_cov_4.246390_2_plen_82_part_00
MPCCSGAFGALAGDDLTEAAAHATASAAPALSSVPERGGSYHRPRTGTGAFGALAGGPADSRAPRRLRGAAVRMGMGAISE